MTFATPGEATAAFFAVVLTGPDAPCRTGFAGTRTGFVTTRTGFAVTRTGFAGAFAPRLRAWPAFFTTLAAFFTTLTGFDTRLAGFAFVDEGLAAAGFCVFFGRLEVALLEAGFRAGEAGAAFFAAFSGAGFRETTFFFAAATVRLTRAALFFAALFAPAAGFFPCALAMHLDLRTTGLKMDGAI